MAKIQNIQALRGVAVLFVVLFHLVSIEQKYGGSETILLESFQFGMYGVDLFFVISGFVMVAVTRGRFQNKIYALKFIYRRASRIYPTYWFYTILVLIVFFIRPSWVNSSQGNQVDICASFLLLPSQNLPLLMVGWTLIHEMYFYLIFFLILLLVSERNMPATIISWGISVLFLNVGLKSSSLVMGIVSHPLTIEFIGGCLIALIYYKRNSQAAVCSLIMIASSVLIASMFGYVYYRTLTRQIEPIHWWRVLIFGVPAMLMVYCFVNAEKRGFVLHSSLIKVGDASYSIYLSHLLTLSAAGRVWSVFSTNAVYDNAIMIPVLFCLVIFVGIISYHLVEKPLLELSRKIA